MVMRRIWMASISHSLALEICSLPWDSRLSLEIHCSQGLLNSHAEVVEPLLSLLTKKFSPVLPKWEMDKVWYHLRRMQNSFLWDCTTGISSILMQNWKDWKFMIWKIIRKRIDFPGMLYSMKNVTKIIISYCLWKSGHSSTFDFMKMWITCILFQKNRHALRISFNNFCDLFRQVPK